LTSSTNALPVGGTTQLIAQVIEPSGTPPHSGTQITFTTTIGSIEPAQAETDAGGRVVVTFKAGNENGTATITALSGGASASGNNAIKIAIGTAAVGGVRVSANPTQVPAFGGSSTITANVFDINGNALASAPVVFTTSAGTLNPTIINTNISGVAQSTLTTTTQATVTATVGAQGAPGATGATGSTGSTTPTTGQASGTVTVGVLGAPSLVITPPTSAPSVGIPANFTFAVSAASSNGSPVTNVSVDWGDGSGVQDLGAISGSVVVSHVYRVAATYIIHATLTDASGNRVPVNSSVTVIPVPRPTSNIHVTLGAVGTDRATFNITITTASGISIQDVTIHFGDGKTQDLGGAPTGTIDNVQHTYPAPGTYTASVDVLDSSGTVTTATVDVTVS
jgi:hypothetical protein